MATHDPYVPAAKSLTELTIGAIVLGCALGPVFAASSVCLALKVGNNIAPTTGSSGESVATSVVFTLPALLLLGYALPWSKVAASALAGHSTLPRRETPCTVSNL
jgi:uncharacterized oligopeptide transporter (OPT) family protein